MTKQRHLHDWFTLFALVVFWGSSFALTKIAVASISPLWLMALRLSIGAAVLYVMMRAEGLTLPLDRTMLLWFFWLGAIGSILPFYLIAWGAQYIASGLVGILMALMPLVTITLAHFLLPDEPLSTSKITGFVVGLSGLVILMGPHFLEEMSFTGTASLAQLAILFAASSYALQAVTARLSPELTPLQKSTGVLTAAAIGGLIIALVADPEGFGPASVSSWLATLALGVFPTAFAALLLFRLIDRAGASFVSVSNYLIPPFAYLLGILALDETFEIRALLGLAIILLGIYLAERGKTVAD